MKNATPSSSSEPKKTFAEWDKIEKSKNNPNDDLRMLRRSNSRGVQQEFLF